MTSPATISARNRANALSKHHGKTDPRTRAALARLAELRLAEQIAATPLEPEQRSRLAGLLLSGGA